MTDPEPDLAELKAREVAREKHFAAIGKVAESWASVELMVDMASWKVAGIEMMTGAALTSQIGGIQRKLDALISLLKLKGGFEKVVKNLNKFSADARALGELRNRVVHDPWLVSEAIPTRFEVSGRRVAVADLIEMPTDEVMALYDKIEVLWERLRVIHAEIGVIPRG